MASEITVTIAASLANGNLIDNFQPGSKVINQTTRGQNGGTIAFTTAISQISKGSVSTYGWMFLRNTEATGGPNLIYGPHSTTLVNMGELRPGESAAFRVTAGTTMAGMASSAAGVKCLVKIWED